MLGLKPHTLTGLNWTQLGSDSCVPSVKTQIWLPGRWLDLHPTLKFEIFQQVAAFGPSLRHRKGSSHAIMRLHQSGPWVQGILPYVLVFACVHALSMALHRNLTFLGDENRKQKSRCETNTEQHTELSLYKCYLRIFKVPLHSHQHVSNRS